MGRESVVAASCLVLGLAACQPSNDSAARGSAAVATPGAAAEPARLVGAWQRTDSDYQIVIESTTPEGRLQARYLNPRPINVARAQWQKDGARLRLLVELRDQGYPGSNYELDYDAAHDTLFGTYHHLGLNQDFQVSFYRLGKEGTGS